MYNHIFRQAPNYGWPPMYTIMAHIMNTQGGFSAFTKQNLNFHYKQMMLTWERFLLSAESRGVINDDPKEGWVGTTALKAMLEAYPDRTFEQVFICDTAQPFYGFTSFEDFFNRRFREPKVDRPTGPIENLKLISAPCESQRYAIQVDVKRTDQLFIKDEAYSLVHLLANDDSVDSFVGGVVIQSFLSTYDYHRWHAPVNGYIRRIVDVPGTYFAQAPSTIGDPVDGLTGSQLPPYLKSLQYFANTATRQLMFIEADNPSIGLMCFIAIGMTEISSCQATVFEGQHVNRGDELGMFHFGGSSSAMVFRKEAQIQVDMGLEKFHVNFPIAVSLA
jgi:phosphatidylserine decarboxylase